MKPHLLSTIKKQINQHGQTSKNKPRNRTTRHFDGDETPPANCTGLGGIRRKLFDAFPSVPPSLYIVPGQFVVGVVREHTARRARPYGPLGKAEFSAEKRPRESCSR